ncbi:MAG: thioredoxin domain-containing protein [Candidatus Daviesbacteria bacterium]|nr:thioredoxin domain-containing protein [Candidatus Daviesbacteria bacterium]
MDSKKSFFTPPVAILAGSIIIALAILIAGGTISIPLKAVKGVKTEATVPTPRITQVPEQPAITLDIIKNAFFKASIKFGDVNKKLIAIEISDPSCPYCQVAAGQNSALNKQMGPQFTLVADGGTYVAPVVEIEKLITAGKAAFAWIYYPGHGAGEMGTKAMYCAFEKGKFWEVHNLIMSEKGYDLLNDIVKNDKTKSADIAEFLAPVFDSVAMKACLDSGKYDQQLRDDMAIATSLGVRGTPGFYLNTANFPGAVPFSAMESVVNSALK